MEVALENVSRMGSLANRTIRRFEMISQLLFWGLILLSYRQTLRWPNKLTKNCQGFFPKLLEKTLSRFCNRCWLTKVMLLA